MEKVFEIIKAIIVYFGGGIGIAIGLVLLAKGLIVKWVETVIDSSAQKSITKLTDSLQRHTKAFEKLLDKEFSFYDESSKYTSKLVVDIQDICFWAKKGNNVDAVNCMIRILEEIPSFKNQSLLYQSYIPNSIFSATSNLLSNLQDKLDDIVSIMKNSPDNNGNEQELKNLETIQDKTLLDCAFLMASIKTRLETLANSEA